MKKEMEKWENCRMIIGFESTWLLMIFCCHIQKRQNQFQMCWLQKWIRHAYNYLSQNHCRQTFQISNNDLEIFHAFSLELFLTGWRNIDTQREQTTTVKNSRQVENRIFCFQSHKIAENYTHNDFFINFRMYYMWFCELQIANFTFSVSFKCAFFRVIFFRGRRLLQCI